MAQAGLISWTKGMNLDTELSQLGERLERQAERLDDQGLHSIANDLREAILYISKLQRISNIIAINPTTLDDYSNEELRELTSKEVHALRRQANDGTT